jgi:hypothetical protein
MKARLFSFENLKFRKSIDVIREKYPGKWTYDSRSRQWNCDDGSYIAVVSSFAPRYDGDDDTFVTLYYHYFPNDKRPPEQVYF